MQTKTSACMKSAIIRMSLADFKSKHWPKAAHPDLTLSFKLLKNKQT